MCVLLIRVQSANYLTHFHYWPNVFIQTFGQFFEQANLSLCSIKNWGFKTQK